jgi:class 3 adenylate cyclase
MPQMQIFIKKFCEKIGELTQKSKLGRVDKFIGDGAILLFGEELPQGKDKEGKCALVSVLDCIRTAILLIHEFKELYKHWLDNGFSENRPPNGDPRSLVEVLQEYNENVEIDIAIGINFGTVYFDYFGYEGHYEYTAIGDHMNYAQRLENAAARKFSDDHNSKANILLSKTVYQILTQNDGLYFPKETLPKWSSVKGYNNEYPIYELDIHSSLTASNLNRDTLEKDIDKLLKEIREQSKTSISKIS